MSAAESIRAYSRSSCTRLDLYVPLYALPDTTAGCRYGESDGIANRREEKKLGVHVHVAISTEPAEPRGRVKVGSQSNLREESVKSASSPTAELAPTTVRTRSRVWLK